VSERVSGRHRASHKSTSSPLSTLTGSLSLVGDRVGTVRRSGVIIAMSSGLVASMALPAHAVASAPAQVGGQTAEMPAVGGEGSSAFFSSPESGLLSLPAGLALDDGTVSAPSTATLDFDRTSFVAVPAPTTTPDDAPAPVDRHDQGDATPGDAAPSTRKAETPAPTTRRAARTTTSTTTSGAASRGTTRTAASVPASASGSAAVAIASRYVGVPYRYGGTSPNGFDCSGLIQYVYAQLGKSLPRTAAEQASAVRHIPRSQAMPGDLVLFAGGGHIAIYLGDGMMLDAPHTGTVVQIRKIYTSNVSFGHVL